MTELQEQLTKLANEKPELRGKLVPILKQGASKWTAVKNSMSSVGRSVKSLNQAIKDKDERKMVFEAVLVLKFLAGTFHMVGNKPVGDVINDAANKLEKHKKY